MPGKAPERARKTQRKPTSKNQGRPSGRRVEKDERVELFGIHAVSAALDNPARTVHELYVTENSATKLSNQIAARSIDPIKVKPKDLNARLGADTVHQGVLLVTAPLPSAELRSLQRARRVVVLDQITDPHNVGAILRSCAAFGVSGLVMTWRHSPPLTGTLAKSASGGLDTIPICLVRNLAEALEQLHGFGFTTVGLAGEAKNALVELNSEKPIALVLGAEGKGLRQLTRETCQQLVRIDMSPAVESLNVSNAAAIALHHFYTAESG